MNNLKETVEALIFASGDPLSKKDLIEHIPALTARELNGIVEDLKLKYSGDSGIVLSTFNGKMQFTSNPKYGETLAEVLTPLRERALSQSLLEVLSVVAYKQPVTRLEIEEIKGKDPDYALSVLSRVNLIEVKGRKDTVGRPVLFGTTDEFLRKFGLEDLSELPDYKEVLERIATLDEHFRDSSRESLYFTRNAPEPDMIISGGEAPSGEPEAAPEESAEEPDEFEDEIPDFLKGEDIEEYS